MQISDPEFLSPQSVIPQIYMRLQITSADPTSGTTTSTSSRRAGRRRIAVTTGSSRASASTASRRAASSPTSTRRRWTVRKIEGNPLHPGQPRPHLRQGRGHAEPARGSRSDPLSAAAATARAAPASGGRCRGTRRSTDIGGRHPQGDRREPPARDHVSRRPAGRGRLRQPRPAGVGRRRPQQPHQRLLLVGAPRAFPVDAATTGRRPTTPTRRRSCCCRRTSRPATTSTRTRSASSKAQSQGATLIVIDPRLSNTSAKADLWLPAYSGTEGALLLAMARVLLDEELYDRDVRARLGRTGADYLRAERTRIWPSTFESFIDALKELYAQFTPEFAAGETGVAAGRRSSRRRARSAARGTVQHPQLARRGRGQSVGLADHALPLPARRPDRQRRHGRRRRTCTSRTSSCPKHPNPPPPPDYWNELLFPREFPLVVPRDELSAAALPQGRPRQARRLLHARLQPAVDQSRRLLVDGGAAGPRQDRPARRRCRRRGAKRRGSPTTSCRWGSAPSATTR